MSKLKLTKKILLGLDDIAHNRLYRFPKGKPVKVKNYGKRMKGIRCYCKELKRK